MAVREVQFERAVRAGRLRRRSPVPQMKAVHLVKTDSRRARRPPQQRFSEGLPTRYGRVSGSARARCPHQTNAVHLLHRRDPSLAQLARAGGQYDRAPMTPEAERERRAPQRSARRAGRPPPLITADSIAEAAVELLDEVGDFTMTQLARRLGVGASALYNHVAGKEEVLARVRELVSDRIDVKIFDSTPCSTRCGSGRARTARPSRATPRRSRSSRPLPWAEPGGRRRCTNGSSAPS